MPSQIPTSPATKELDPTSQSNSLINFFPDSDAERRDYSRAGVASLALLLAGAAVNSYGVAEVSADLECAAWTHPPYIPENCFVWVDTGSLPTTISSGGGGGGGGTNTTSPPRPPAKTWEQTIAERCLDQPNNDSLATSLDVARATDGSGRLVVYARECGISFVGDVVPDLGRPMTNVDWAVLDPANNITPNQAQLDILRASADAQWLAEHPELATTTTLPPATSTTTAVPSTTTPIATTTTNSVTTTVPVAVTGPLTSSTIASPSVGVANGSSGGGPEAGGVGVGELLVGGSSVALLLLAVYAIVLRRRRRESEMLAVAE